MTRNDDPGPQDPLEAMSALGEPNRRALYDYVVTAGGWVGRSEAAAATDLQPALVAHHLDRLADDGLLEVDFQRLTGRTGPGAGRPAKVYRRARRDFEVSLPPRDYEFVGRLLADAVVESHSTGADPVETVAGAAADAGRRIGQQIKGRQDASTTTAPASASVLEVLRAHGFEPVELEDATVVLRNCPFHLLAQRHTDLICGMNHTLLSAALAEVGDVGYDAVLEPESDTCCVRLRRR